MKRSLVLVVALAVSATAGPRRRVIVLPIDGTADAATRSKLTQSVQRLARVIDGDVQAGNTTLAETAAAVGCDPEKPACVEQVRATLGFDEVVYGVATKDDDDVTVVLHRAAKGKDPRSVTATLGAKDSPDTIEPTLLPLFTGARAAPAPTPVDSPAEPNEAPATTDAPAAAATTAQRDANPTVTGTEKLGDASQVPEGTRLRRNLALTAVGGGGLMFLIGIGLWSSASGLQDQIDAHPTSNLADINDLRALEDKGQGRALVGDLMVLGGLALGGYGGWILWKDHKAQQMSVTPTATDHGAAITFTFVGGSL